MPRSFHTPDYAETGAIVTGFALTWNDRDPADTRLRASWARASTRWLEVYSNAVAASARAQS
jgi:hypothetical protein